MLLDFLGCEYILAPGDLHRQILKSQPEKTFSRPRLITYEDFIESGFFKLHPRAIFALMNNYALTYEYAKTICDNLYLLKTLPDAKIIDLQKYLTFLDAQNLIIRNPYFSEQYKGKKIGVFGYPIDEELLALKNQYSLNFVELKLTSPKVEKTVLTFSSMEEEVRFFFNYVAHELTAGRPIESMVLFNPSEDYYPLLKLYSRYFQIPIDLPSTVSLFESPVGQEVYRYFLNHSLEETVHNFLIDETKYQKYLRLLKEVEISGLIDKKQQNEYLKHLFTTTKISIQKEENSIKIITKQYQLEEKFVTILGLMDGSFPHYYQDNDYLSDLQKTKLGRTSSYQKNGYAEQTYLAFLLSIKEGLLSLPLNVNGRETFISPLIKKAEFKINKAPLLTEDYSQAMAYVYGAGLIEENEIYQKRDARLASYQNKLDIPYNQYNYRYHKVDYLTPRPLKLSYSSLNNFYLCQFRYFADKVLRAGERNESFHLDFGNITHELFEILDKETISFEEAFEKIIFKYRHKFSAKEQVFLQKLKVDLKKAVDFNQNYVYQANFYPIYSEQSLTLTLTPDIYLYGKVDRIMVINGPDSQSLAIVDFKTGSETFEYWKVEYGLSLQLPIYALLATSLPEHGQLPLVGFYIQNVLSLKSSSDKGASEDTLQNNLYWHGLTTDNYSRILTFDPSFTSLTSQFIRSLKLKKDGTTFYASSKIASDFEGEISFYRLKETAKAKVIAAGEAILNNEFEINPKMIKTDSACKTCPFLDICHRPDDLPWKNVIKPRSKYSKTKEEEDE